MNVAILRDDVQVFGVQFVAPRRGGAFERVAAFAGEVSTLEPADHQILAKIRQISWQPLPWTNIGPFGICDGVTWMQL